MENPIVKETETMTAISFFTPDDRVESTVKENLDRFFMKRTGQGVDLNEVRDVIYTCVKELIINASKANIKKTFFIEAKIDENDLEMYRSARKNFKKLLTDRYFSYIREKLRKHNLDVGLEMEDQGDGIVIMVKNPHPLHLEEEKEIRKRLSSAMRDDAAELAVMFDMENGNLENEGAGLGLTLIIQLLRQTGIRPDYFRIGVQGDATMARIEIPLNDRYISIRDRYVAH